MAEGQGLGTPEYGTSIYWGLGCRVQQLRLLALAGARYGQNAGTLIAKTRF